MLRLEEFILVQGYSDHMADSSKSYLQSLTQQWFGQLRIVFRSWFARRVFRLIVFVFQSPAPKLTWKIHGPLLWLAGSWMFYPPCCLSWFQGKDGLAARTQAHRIYDTRTFLLALPRNGFSMKIGEFLRGCLQILLFRIQSLKFYPSKSSTHRSCLLSSRIERSLSQWCMADFLLNGQDECNSYSRTNSKCAMEQVRRSGWSKKCELPSLAYRENILIDPSLFYRGSQSNPSIYQFWQRDSRRLVQYGHSFLPFLPIARLASGTFNRQFRLALKPLVETFEAFKFFHERIMIMSNHTVKPV